jgi:hypothetical protein
MDEFQCGILMTGEVRIEAPWVEELQSALVPDSG